MYLRFQIHGTEMREVNEICYVSHIHVNLLNIMYLKQITPKFDPIYSVYMYAMYLEETKFDKIRNIAK